MSARYENIINLMSGNGPGSSTLEQHCSAMRMDDRYANAYNAFIWAFQAVKDDIRRVSRDPVADLDGVIAELRELAELAQRPDLLSDMDRYGVVALEWAGFDRLYNV